MNRNKRLEVRFDGRFVGTLALIESGPDQNKVAFEYSEEWLQNGFSINPFSLPLRKGVFIPRNRNFGGLFGAFGDALPDSWGKLLVDRMLVSQGINPDEIGILDRLSIVGTSGMGALTFHPEETFKTTVSDTDFDKLADLCSKILLSKPVDDLDTVFLMGGSSGGTRPKVLAVADGEDWIVKFRASNDPKNFGKQEFDYAVCAAACGINMPPHKLFPSKKCDGYFGIKRFDREKDKDGKTKRIHMLSVAALLELDFNAPSADYNDLMKLTRILTRENRQDVEDMYRRMCFNVFAHNRDDHTKNFSFLFDEKQSVWRLSPAYDLTYSTTYFGEHTTSVNGNGADPTKDDLLAVGIKAGLSKQWCTSTAENIQTTVNSHLKVYLTKAY
ncbi:MAG: type II toxin-antitoxin system HipA family toxin [Clostridia bacterium]|nr:type II toxin-antitoxin system HipA family toxin [Clostridia bacterium]